MGFGNCNQCLLVRVLGFASNISFWGFWVSQPIFPKQELLGSSPQKKKERAWRGGVWMCGTRLAWGPRLRSGPRSLDGWHAALDRGVWMGFGPGGRFGWVARGSGAGGPRSLDGTRLGAAGPRFGSWHMAQELGARRLNGFGWVARSWGPAVLDGWHAALELGLAQL